MRILFFAVLCGLAPGLVGCSTAESRARSAAIAALAPETRQKVERGIVEPGFTPELVLLALGRPSAAGGSDLEHMRDGVWKYPNPHRNDRDFVRSGWRQRRVFDPDRRSDVIITEPVDDRAFPNLRDYTLEIEFRDGRVTNVRRVQL